MCTLLTPGTVTHAGDRKSRQMIRRAKHINPQAVVVVTGCYAQTSPEDVAAIEDVDIILGTNKRHLIVDMVEQFSGTQQQLVDEKDSLTDFEEISMERVIQKARAYLKVQEGCEQFCTYVSFRMPVDRCAAAVWKIHCRKRKIRAGRVPGNYSDRDSPGCLWERNRRIYLG